ncbi:TonB-dependent receptor plug domain-containing protein [Prosthecochloris aestuarii]|nr:TonB-dependent receptor [Prosthecochloris aestuarii]
MKKQFFLFVAVGLLATGVVRGDDVSEGKALKRYNSDELVVSATKTLNSISDAGGSSVTVITAEEIENSGQQSVEEVLKGNPGIDIASNGGPGTNTSIFLRGADSKYTLVLIDGVPANDPAEGSRSPNLSHLTTDNIERIEIVRGPASLLFGSGASAGLINIITKKGSSTPEAYAGIEGGSYSTYKYYAGANGRKGIFDYSFSASRLKSDGFSATDEENSCVNPAGESFEDDGYENTSLSGNIGLHLNEHVTFETVMRYTNANSQYDGPGVDVVGNEQDAEQLNGRVALTMDYEPLVSTMYYNFNRQDRDYLTDGALSSTYHGYLYELGWQGDLAVADNNTISAGLNYQHESMQNESFGMYASAIDQDISSNSIFIQDQWRSDGVQLIGGIRYEDNEQFGGETTFRFAPSWTVDHTVFKCSYGTAFRAPSLYQLYSPYGNEDLSAETSKGWDAGFEHSFSDDVKVGVTYFRIDYEDRIDFDMNTWTYAQVDGKTKTFGVESFAEWAASNDFFLTFNYTYTLTEDPDGSQLLRRPKNKVALSGTYDLSEKTKLSTSLRWVGSRKDSGAKDENCIVTNKLDSYFLVNLSGSCQLTDSIALYGRVDNLFDEDYEDAWRYATPGRSAYAGIKLIY